MKSIRYCEEISCAKRWKSREVMVGSVGVGGNNPVRIQSMTTSSTRDVDATIDQIIKLADYGCEIARVTVQGMKEAEACEQIKNGLLQKGYTIPVVADIHFYPPAAMKVVEFVDKVRVNPGNFVDKRASFQVIEYDDDSYAKEIKKIEEKFTPLVEKCKVLKRAMRIGTNHGSLSDRIMNRYGDTPKGMVESALEFARVCRMHDYHDFIFSMKASNPQVMVQAYRLLVAEMMALGWDYPLHLGVTEAGEGEDGRVKSAMGIGALLLDGLGDTIRVSLTEDPWLEIDPCKRLVNFGENYLGKGIDSFEEKHRNVAAISRREVQQPKAISTHRDGTVVLKVTNDDIAHPDFFKNIGCRVENGEPKLDRGTADILLIEEKPTGIDKLRKLQEIGISTLSPHLIEGGIRLFTLDEALEEKQKARFALPMSKSPLVVQVTGESYTSLKELKPDLILFRPDNNRLHESRHFFEWLQQEGIEIPAILCFDYDKERDDVIIEASAECGALLCDGQGEGICITTPCPIKENLHFSFNILQGARMRTFKTEFISCPSCGRTLFDLQEVTRRIRARTDHLPGVKIGIMGCIVNGPGEMADSDFGYVGSRPGMIDLYVGKTRVEKNIPFDEADDRLISLIKAYDRWEEPQKVSS